MTNRHDALIAMLIDDAFPNKNWGLFFGSQPDTTATYWIPSTMNDEGEAMMPEFVGNSQRISPFFASNARNLRSLVPPLNTSPPPVVIVGPQFALFAKLWVHTRLPVSTFHACTSPM